LSYTANVFFLMISYDFCLFPAQYYYIIVIHTDWKLCANSEPLCTLENFQWCAELCFAGAVILSDRCLSIIPRREKHKSLLI
jgi:hypothetical protein